MNVLLVRVDDEDEAHEHFVTLRGKGPQWYMVSQLRDDMKEGRLASAPSESNDDTRCKGYITNGSVSVRFRLVPGHP